MAERASRHRQGRVGSQSGQAVRWTNGASLSFSDADLSSGDLGMVRSYCLSELNQTIAADKLGMKQPS